MTLRAVVCAAAVIASLSCNRPTPIPAVTYRLPAVELSPIPPGRNAQAEFAKIFCDVLRHDASLDDPPVGWESCGQYIEGGVEQGTSALSAIPTKYRVLLVSGIFSECLAPQGIAAFSQGLAHLKARHGLDAMEAPVSGVGSSTVNAKQINDFLQTRSGEYIAIGYSKGAPDLMEAMTTAGSPAATRIKALVTVAGAVGGSRLPDVLSDRMEEWLRATLKQSGIPGCSVKDAGGIESLRRSTRQAFLARYVATAPGFSIVGMSDEQTTSRVLQLPWTWLSQYSRDQDSQVIAEESVLPGGTYLGVARADHWAIALPFWEKHADAAEVNKNRFPRTALLEAIVRFVAARLPQ
jgi:hypothetical protein